MKKLFVIFLCALSVLSGCEPDLALSSDSIQASQQEKILQEGTAQVGMPAIKNFRERKLLKTILEMRDQDSLTTYAYTFADNTGKLNFLCDSIGFGLPAAEQFTNPEHYVRVDLSGGGYGYQVLPQADPNGLFSPSSAEGTWVMCKDPNGPDVKPVYIEPRVIVSPFKLNTDQAQDYSLKVTGR